MTAARCIATALLMLSSVGAYASTGDVTVINVPPEPAEPLPTEGSFTVVPADTVLNIFGDAGRQALNTLDLLVRDSGAVANVFPGDPGDEFVDVAIDVLDGGVANVETSIVSARIELGGTMNVSGGDISFLSNDGFVSITGEGRAATLLVGQSETGHAVIDGGSVYDILEMAGAGVRVEILSGSILPNPGVQVIGMGDGAVLSVRGGFVGFDNATDGGIGAGATVEFFGTEFFLDDGRITDLRPGESLEITQRDVRLSGLLEDGSAFGIDLVAQREFFSIDPDATFRITLVPEPSAIAAALVLVAASLANGRAGG